MQGFEDVLQQCACQRDRGCVAVLQTGGEPVIYKNVQRPIVSWEENTNENENVRNPDGS